MLKNQKLFPINSQADKNNSLIIGGCNTLDLAKEYGTPLYVIDENTFTTRAEEYTSSLNKHYDNFLVLYASKAFACMQIFKIANALKLGVDVVSGGELYIALKSGTKSEDIYFHGNNKSKEEIEYAIKEKVGRIICDNFYELELIHETCKDLNTEIEILLRLTPGIECHTHEYIKTGHLDSKFGFDLEDVDSALKLIKDTYKNIKVIGIHAHIGSQIFELRPFEDTITVLLQQFQKIKEKYNINLNELNIGGGIGISYTQDDDPFSVEKWAKVTTDHIKKTCKNLNLPLPKLICEPGRSLIGPAGITLYKVGSSKQVPNGRKYISVDGGMADNPRPITYQSKYAAVVANKLNSEDLELVTIAGRYCESGDILIKDIELPKTRPGDIIAILNTGAYNYSMSSNYNMVPRPACVLVKDGKSKLIIERETYEDLTLKHRTL